MAAAFRRSISLPGRNPKPGGGGRVCPLQPAKPPPARSTSLPSHADQPAVALVQEELRAAGAWHSSGEPLSSGLLRLELLHLALDGLLQLPQTQEALRRSRSGPSAIAEKLLRDLLLFTDVHGSFRMAVVALQELQAAAQAAVRRRDGERLASLGRSLRKAEKELAAMAPVALGKAEQELPSSSSEGELASILREVRLVTASVSAAVFRGTAAAVSLAAAVVGSKSSSWSTLRRSLPPMSSSSKKSLAAVEETAGQRSTAAMTALAELGECLAALETASERTFRRLINARVSVLNILTP